VTDDSCQVLSLGKFNKAHPSQGQYLDRRSESVQHLRRHLCESLNLRILNVPLPPGSADGEQVRVAVLFSGGLDCTVLARMAHDILPLDEQIDLINVAFENPRVMRAAKDSARAKKGGNEVYKSGNGANCPSLAVDSECLGGQSPFESCPDRETGRKAFQELQSVCPGRCWRFVAVSGRYGFNSLADSQVNVPYTETTAHRSNVINLIHPHNTEMDLSIAYALYFAARGTGVASTNFNTTPTAYHTPARILLSGLGADELFGGYTRHATAWARQGFMGLLDELKLDIERLGKRNLGRDDRVISHWGREARFPYLDEALVKWAVESPIWQKCDFQSNVLVEREIPNLEPGKKVLRLLAYELGMHSVAQEKKRAVRLPFSLGMISLTANRFNLGQGRRRWNWVIQKAQC
jgi:asparagine synthetase B (glutamine-hydrolysing)